MRRGGAGVRGALGAAALGSFVCASAGQPGPSSPGGLLELYPWPEEAVNRVQNPSFEEGSGGQVAAWMMGDPAHFFAASGVSRSGTSSMQLKDSHLARFSPNANQDLVLPPGWYSMKGWMKAERAGANNPNAGGRFSLWWGKSAVATPLIRGNTDWTSYGRRGIVILPGEAASIRLEAYAKPDGNVFFDDVEVRRLAPPVVEGFLLYPNYRGFLFEDHSQTIRMSVTVRPEQAQVGLSDMVVRLSLFPEAAGRAAASVEEVPSKPSFPMALDARSLPLGSYTLTLQAFRRGAVAPLFEYPSYRIVKASARDRKSLRLYVDEDGVLVRDGRRVFVLGIYDTSGYSDAPASYQARLSKIAEAPLNMYLNYWFGRAPTSALKALMIALQKYGMSYLHTVNFWYEGDEQWPLLPPCAGQTPESAGQGGYTACRARELGTEAGLAGWYTADERDADQAARVFGQYKVLRQSDRGGLTFIAQNQPRELPWWRDVADVMGVDPYPIFGIPLGSPSPLEMVTDWVDQAQAAVERSRPVWAVIQFFQFGSQGHWPTYEELRTMSYMALVGGAKGLFYWSYGARALAWVKDPALQEEYWQRLVRLTREIKSLEPALLSPDAPEVLVGHAPGSVLRVLAKRAGDARYVIAVNNTPRETQAGFTLAQPATTVEVVGEGRSVGTSGAAAYGDRFAPYAVHVYRIGPAR